MGSLKLKIEVKLIFLCWKLKEFKPLLNSKQASWESNLSVTVWILTCDSQYY